MFSRLTPFSKFLLTVLILAGIFFLGKYLLNNTSYGLKIKEQSEEVKKEGGMDKDSKGSSSGSMTDLEKSAVRVGVVTWGGYAGGQYFNEGFKANTNSRFYKEYGFPVDFKILDDLCCLNSPLHPHFSF